LVPGTVSQTQGVLPMTQVSPIEWTFRSILENRPEEVPHQYKQSFARLVLVDPGSIDMAEANLIEKICPQEWQHYCEWHWGRPDRMSS
jgi:hypothetical protein